MKTKVKNSKTKTPSKSKKVSDGKHPVEEAKAVTPKPQTENLSALAGLFAAPATQIRGKKTKAAASVEEKPSADSVDSKADKGEEESPVVAPAVVDSECEGEDEAATTPRAAPRKGGKDDPEVHTHVRAHILVGAGKPPTACLPLPPAAPRSRSGRCLLAMSIRNSHARSVTIQLFHVTLCCFLAAALVAARCLEAVILARFVQCITLRVFPDVVQELERVFKQYGPIESVRYGDQDGEPPSPALLSLRQVWFTMYEAV
jgi:hypothetical protein